MVDHADRSQRYVAVLPAVLAYIHEVAGKAGFAGDDLQRIQIAAEEAVTNIIKHAFEPGQKETFDVICEEVPLGFRIVIRERGIPFDPKTRREYSKNKLQEEFSAEGLGTYMMSELMDEISFHNNGREGKETHLVKYLGSRSIEEYLPPAEIRQLKKEEAQGPAPGTASYAVRLMKPEEAVEVSKCAYMSYGYTYTHESIYYPERIRQLNESGKLVSLVAVTAEGEIVGHIGLIADAHDSSIFEGGMAFVKPSFRGRGCLNRMMDAMIDEAERRNLTGIYGLATATHKFSQKGIHKYGMFPTALILSKLMPAEYRGIEKASSERRSSVYSFRYLRKPQQTAVYAPPRHREMMAKLYRGISVEPYLMVPETAAAALPDGDAQLTLSTDENKTAKIEIAAYGRAVPEEVRSLVKRLCTERLETIYLYLNLSDPLTALLAEEFETMGFFFGGIIPGSPGNDRLLLQYFNNQVLQYDKLDIATELGRELLAYVRSRDPAQ